MSTMADTCLGSPAKTIGSKVSSVLSPSSKITDYFPPSPKEDKEETTTISKYNKSKAILMKKSSLWLSKTTKLKYNMS